MSVLSIAPMLQWTDSPWRYLMRQITRETVLYTEMTMDVAILHHPNELENFLGPASFDGPLAVQLGGCDPMKVAQAAKLCEEYSTFEEINLNCGCPSNRAKRVGFGAELMLDPELVRKILAETCRQVCHTNVTIKCRLGVTGRNSYDDLVEFIKTVESAGIRRVIVHARCCELFGLSPAQNRSIPPLQYHQVYRLVQDFPELQFVINGGIESFEQAEDHLSSPSYPVHGVMIGREAYRNPWLFADADRRFFHKRNHGLTRIDVLETYFTYCDELQEKKTYGYFTCNLLKPLHNFFHGCGKANILYKRKLDEMTKLYSKNESYSIRDIAMTTIDETIPQSFLESNGLEVDY